MNPQPGTGDEGLAGYFAAKIAAAVNLHDLGDLAVGVRFADEACVAKGTEHKDDTNDDRKAKRKHKTSLSKNNRKRYSIKGVSSVFASSEPDTILVKLLL
jgi:hypothetical protein